MPGKTLACLALLATAGAASAETLICSQTRLSSNGFTSVAAAQSWFPKRFGLRFEGQTVISDFYGKGSWTDKGGRRDITFVTSTSDNKRVEVRMLFIEKSGIYTARLGAEAGYTTTNGAKGKCKRAK